MTQLELPLDDMIESQDYIEKINTLAQLCHHIAESKGFHEDHRMLLRVLHNASPDLTSTEQGRLLSWFESTVEQAEIARMHSEASEWLEGIRKGYVNDEHLPKYLSAEVEAADLIIRVLDTCAKREYRVGEAIIAKLRYNLSRPFKHGKNS